MRPLPIAVALVVLASPPAAHAVPITGFATGTIARDSSRANGTGPPPYVFTVGETVSVRFTYDLDADPATGGVPVPLVAIATGGGYSTTLDDRGPSLASVVDGELRLLSILPGGGGADLRFVGDVGRIEYRRDLDVGGEGFVADVTRTTSPVPEPSTLAPGLVGAMLAGLGWWGRRLAA